MELIKSAARRTRISEVAYVLLNVVYAAAVLLLLVEFEGQPYLAYLLVIISKWRVFAVRPRFWMANIRANMLDTLVGVGVVTLLWQNMGNTAYQIALTCAFVLWLVFLKPLSKRFWVVAQGGVGQFIALTALFTVAYTLPVEVVVGLAGLVGFVVARHVINIYSDEYEDVVLSVGWGLVIAEISWLGYYWTVAYTSFRIPQISLITSLLGYMALVVYNYLYRHEDLKNMRRDVGLPIVFSLVGIALILLVFNNFDPTSL